LTWDQAQLSSRRVGKEQQLETVVVEEVGQQALTALRPVVEVGPPRKWVLLSLAQLVAGTQLALADPLVLWEPPTVSFS
jgi:hypothetical protein